MENIEIVNDRIAGYTLRRSVSSPRLLDVVAMNEKAGDTRTWNDLTPQHQHIVIHSINMLLFVLGDK